MVYAEPCRCVGRPLRFERGQCFTCGRTLGQFIGTRERSSRATGESAGYKALLRKVHALQDKQRRKRPAPRHNHRRVVIEPAPSSAVRMARAALGVTV